MKNILKSASKKILPFDDETCNKIFKNNKDKDSIESSTRIYNLLLEEQNNIKNKDKFWANLKQLRN